MTGLVDEGRAMGIVCFDFSKAFDTVSRKILIEKLLIYGLDKQIVKWKWKLAEWVGPEGADQ